jgi:RNA recognition motif-containing protein
MASKLYVGGLPYSVTGGRLQELFSPHGTVESANVISDKFTGSITRLRFCRNELRRSAAPSRRTGTHLPRQNYRVTALCPLITTV